MSKASSYRGVVASISEQASKVGVDRQPEASNHQVQPPAAEGWSIVPSPDSGGELRDVTCISASDCWAVGNSYDGSDWQTLVERWDGTAWAIFPAPSFSGFLNGVTCVSASDCWAVGREGPQNGLAVQKTLVVRWNGISWSKVSSPNVDPDWVNQLWDVTCASASDCWAVGSYRPRISYGDQTLVLRWNGTAWSIVPSPNSSPFVDNYLLGVTCVSASDCWAVGYYSGRTAGTLIERWDGIAWTIVPSPSSTSGSLWDVTCTSATDCWAVGQDGKGRDDGASARLIERWDGIAWTSVPPPNPNLAGDNLLGVTCASASNCWAVGSYYNDERYTQTLIEKWDGTSWAVVTAPSATSSYLWGVTCVSASDCWAVGYSFDEGGPLILKYTGTPLSCGGLTPTRVGTDGVDVLSGTAGPDVIHGLGGNDGIEGLGGNDVICGGDGNDTVYGNDGGDKLYGQNGSDILMAGKGNDIVEGGTGNDTLKGEAGTDTLRGDAGDDSMDGGPGTDTCTGGTHVAGDKAVRCESVSGVP